MLMLSTYLFIFRYISTWSAFFKVLYRVSQKKVSICIFSIIKTTWNKKKICNTNYSQSTISELVLKIFGQCQNCQNTTFEWPYQLYKTILEKYFFVKHGWQEIGKTIEALTTSGICTGWLSFACRIWEKYCKNLWKGKFFIIKHLNVQT